MLGQIRLGHIAGDDRDRAEADPGQKHFHLLDRRVLRLVEDHECIVEGTPTHVGERRDLDHVALDQLHDLFDAEHLVERIVKWSKIRIDFLGQVAGQEAELLAGLDRGSHQDEALHAVLVERIDRHRDC